MTIANRIRCVLCPRKRTRTERLTYDGVTTRFALCAAHGSEFQRTFGHWCMLAAAGAADTCCACCDGDGTEKDTFTVLGEVLELRLCPQHADTLALTRGMWLQVGEVEVSEMVAARQHTERVRDLAAVVPARPVQGGERPDARREQIRRQWTFSTHARQRLAGRGAQYGFTEADVLDAIATGTWYPELGGLGVGRFVRDKVSVLVDEQRKTIITIEPNLPMWGEQIVQGA